MQNKVIRKKLLCRLIKKLEKTVNIVRKKIPKNTISKKLNSPEIFELIRNFWKKKPNERNNVKRKKIKKKLINISCFFYK